ncbi:tetratricopeptide repeat protein [Posidoniimonas polymericola]|uniref:tetratricopeptide repeat protein n=1 Tax=Posidoniimonas polymericola TaxID=2528002 RepID=UPI0011B38187|nr:tetratricopeptide repeat protein [Posidoniimonas polymericola]
MSKWLSALLLATIGFSALPAAAQQPTPAPEAARAYAAAAALQDRGLHDLARKDWQALLKSYPTDPLAPRVRYNLGVCRFQQSQFAAAADAFAEAAKTAQEDSVAEAAWSNLGLARFNQASSLAATKPSQAAPVYRQAVAAFEQLLAKFPASGQAGGAQYYRGESLAALGQHEQAAQAYRAALENQAASPLHTAARVALASSELELGQTNQAEATLNTLIAAGPIGQTAGEAYTLRGESRLAGGNAVGAAEDFAQAAAAEQYDAADYALERQAFALYSAGQHAAAATSYRQLGQRFPRSPLAGGANLAAGKCLLLAQQYDEAATLLGSLWRADPSAANAEAAHWLTQTLTAAGRPADAIGPARQALATSPDPQWANPIKVTLADALSESDSGRGEALDLYRQLARSAGGESAERAAYLAAHTALQLKRFDEAQRFAQQFLRQRPNSQFSIEARLIAAEAAAQLKQPQQAADQYRALIAAAADDPRVGEWVLRDAGLLREQQNWAEVASLLSDYQQAIPAERKADALAMLSEARSQSGDAAASIAALTDLIEQRPDANRLAQALYQRGEQQTTRGDLNAANQDFTRIAREFPQSDLAPYALYGLANNQLQSGDKQAGRQSLQTLVDRYGDGPIGEARYTLAGLLHEQQQDAAALDVLDGAKAPAAELSYLRALCLIGAGRTDDARRELQAFLQQHPQHERADQVGYELAWLERKADPAGAAKQFARLAADYPRSPLAAEALLRAGELLYQAGDKQAAAGPLEKVAQRGDAAAGFRAQASHLLGWIAFGADQPEAAAMAFNNQLRAEPTGELAAAGAAMQGESLFALGRYEPALAAYTQAEQLGPKDPRLAAAAWLHAGQAAGQLGRWKESLQWLERAGRASQAKLEGDKIRYERGWALVNLDRPQEAQPIFESLLESQDGVLAARSQFMLGEMQFAAKQYDAAVRTFFRVAYGHGGKDAPEAYHAWQAESLFEAARCLEALGRREPANKLYLELLERFPDSAKARHARAKLQPGATR